MKWLRRLWARMRTRLSGKGNPFELSETVEAVVSPMELQIYRIDADRNGLDLATWLRTTLNAGVSASTLKHLSKGRGNQNVVDMAFAALDEDDILGGPVFPLAPKSKSKYMDKVSGHPCRHLNPDLPKNMTRAECSGSCKSSMRGYGGRPCFWSSLAAKNCDAFQPKTNPTTPTRKR
jgi:hypothetical protein